MEIRKGETSEKQTEHFIYFQADCILMHPQTVINKQKSGEAPFSTCGEGPGMRAKKSRLSFRDNLLFI